MQNEVRGMNIKSRQNKTTCRFIATDDEFSEDFGHSFIYFIVCLACLFGTWGFLCLLFDLLSGNGDISSLVNGWISAVKGI
jgi:hypothetical protein